ncbi:MAG: hypothetical protein FWF91_03210 [Coriobacteriia bacterium]|nr:hypothetical protein [Coriobacteriia bacterium]
MDWRYSRKTTFRYMLTERTTLRDVEELYCFEDGGEIEENDLSAIKAAGSLPYVYPPKIGNDYLRVYSVHEQKGETLEVLHGTFIASTPSSELNRGVTRGSLKMYSLLQIVQDIGITKPLSIPKNTVAISFASSLLAGIGTEQTGRLAVMADASSAKLKSTWTYDAGTSYLEIVNDLASFAGFAPVGIDAFGVIRLFAYTDPTLRAPSVVLRDDEGGCSFAPAVTHELDYFSVPNIVVVILSNDEEGTVATARNDDALSVYSTVSRGREIVHTETVSDIEGQAALDAYAARRLAELSSSVESVEVTHRWMPYATGEGALLSYSEAGFEMGGTIVEKRYVLTPSMPTTMRLRRFIRR